MRPTGILPTGRKRHPHSNVVLPRNRDKRQASIMETLQAAAVSDIVAHGADRILAVFTDARPEADAAGEDWYPEAHRHARRIARLADISVDSAAGIIAALSPRRGWGENLELAYAAATLGHAPDGVFDDQADKVNRILQGERSTDVLGGRKVRSFWRNIADPTRHGAVTIDRHAIAALVGRPLSDAEADEVLKRIGGYRVAAGIYRRVARELGLVPNVLQAIVWTEWRFIHDVAARFDPSESF